MSRTETVTLRVFVCSGDFSGTINISSQTRNTYLITSFSLKHTLLWRTPASKYILSSPRLKAIKDTKSRKEISLSSIRVQTQIKSSIHWRFEFLCQLSLQLSISSCPVCDWLLLFLKPLPLFPHRFCGLWTLSVTLTPDRPSSLPLRTSHESPALTGSDTHHTDCGGMGIRCCHMSTSKPLKIKKDTDS